MKLVAFQDPIFATIQGEGFLVGTPSIFVRLWGCDFSCEWCDTKGSWKPGSAFNEASALAMVDKIAMMPPLKHIVFTGGA